MTVRYTSRTAHSKQYERKKPEIDLDMETPQSLQFGFKKKPYCNCGRWKSVHSDGIFQLKDASSA